MLSHGATVLALRYVYATILYYTIPLQMDHPSVLALRYVYATILFYSILYLSRWTIPRCRSSRRSTSWPPPITEKKIQYMEYDKSAL